MLEIITRAIEIECLPDDIPENFTVDVSELMIGQSKRASDVAADRLHEAGELAGDGDRARGGAARRRSGGRRSKPLSPPKPSPAPPSPKSSRRARRKKKAPPKAEEKGKKK